MKSDEHITPNWETRGKSIAQLIAELNTFEDQTLEVRLSTDDGGSHLPISLVAKLHGACMLLNTGAHPAPAPRESVRPDAIDALVAAPDHHTLLFETEQVRVLETRIAPGERTPVHTHCWPAVLYFLSRSEFVRRDGEGRVMLDSRTIPAAASPTEAIWSPPFPPHSLENVGNTEIRVIAVELKHQAIRDPRQAG